MIGSFVNNKASSFWQLKLRSLEESSLSRHAFLKVSEEFGRGLSGFCVFVAGRLGDFECSFACC